MPQLFIISSANLNALNMNKSRIIYSIFAILFGAFIFVYGGTDDSPGGQLLGFILVIVGVAGIIKSKKKASN